MNTVTTSRRSFLERRGEWLQATLLGAMWVASALAWERVTVPMPTHWNGRGEIDGYGGRFEGLVLVPLIALALYVLLRLLPRFDPARANYASFGGSYAVIRLALTATLAAVHGLVVATALGVPVPVGRVMPMGIGVLLVVIGNVLGKIRPNFFVGVRTPWTLSSARSWEKTHRAAGLIFVAAGTALAAGGLIGAPSLLAGIGITGGLALVWLVYYSYAEWKADPDRVPATRTRPSSEAG